MFLWLWMLQSEANFQSSVDIRLMDHCGSQSKRNHWPSPQSVYCCLLWLSRQPIIRRSGGKKPHQESSQRCRSCAFNRLQGCDFSCHVLCNQHLTWTPISLTEWQGGNVAGEGLFPEQPLPPPTTPYHNNFHWINLKIKNVLRSHTHYSPSPPSPVQIQTDDSTFPSREIMRQLVKMYD